MTRVLLLLFVALLFPAYAKAENDDLLEQADTQMGNKELPLSTTAAAQSIAPIALDLREGQPPESTLVPRSTAAPPIEPSASAPSPSWHPSTWVWVGAGAVVAVACTGLLLAYGTRDRYPTAGFGAQTIGARR